MLRAALIVFVAGGGNALAQTPPAPPAANEEVYELNGVAYRDPYRAMQVDFSAFESWRAEESAYAEKMLAKAPLRQKMFERIKTLDAEEGYSAAPHYANGFSVFLKADEASWSLFRQREGAAPEKILSAADLGEGRSFVPSSIALSPDGRTLAYGVVLNGEAEPRYEFFDVEANAKLPFVIEDPLYADGNGFYGAFAPDSKTFLFAKNPARNTQTPEKEREYHGHVYAWRVGAPIETATALFGDSMTPGVAGEDTPYVSISEDGAWVMVWLRRPLDRQIWAAPAASALAGKPKFRKIATLNPPGAGFDIADDTLYLARLDDSDHGRIERYDLNKKNPEARVLYAPEDGAIAEFVVSADAGYAAIRKAGRFDLVRIKDGVATAVNLPFDGTVDSLDPRPDGGVNFRMSSWVTPKANYSLGADDAAPRASYVIASNPGGENYVSERTEALSRDGTLIPVSIIRRNDVTRTSRNLVYMNVYGCYGQPIDPEYWAATEAILESGAMIAIPHVRGGSDLGGAWYAAQRVRKGVNWEDAVDAARHLVDEKWTAPGLIALEGASCGAAVTANAAMDQPELFGAALIMSPALDWIGGIETPAGARATDEDISTSLGVRKTLAFSPYHRIRDGQRRPAMIVAIGANDYTIPLWDAAKFVARQRAADRADAPPLVLRINETGGHSIAAGESSARTYADAWSYALWRLDENRKRLPKQ